nr:unnamed protein product [Naegleria fowleri]
MIKSSLVTAMPSTASMKHAKTNNNNNHPMYHPHHHNQQPSRPFSHPSSSFNSSHTTSSASYALPTTTTTTTQTSQQHRFPSALSNSPSHHHHHQVHTTSLNNNNNNSSTVSSSNNGATNIDVMFKKIMEAKFSTTLHEIENTFSQYDSQLSSTLRNIEEEFREFLSNTNLKKRSRRGSSSQAESNSPQDSVSTAARGDVYGENDSNSVDCSSSKKRKRSNFSKKDKELLIDWLHQHAEYPYPTDEEKEELLEKVSMTKDQLETWFVNNRKRLLPTNTARKTPAMLQCEQFNMKLEQKLGV